MPASLSKSKPKRRWLQFSLRTFLVLMTGFAVWFGWHTNNAREQRKTVAWVEELRGTVKYDYQIDGKQPIPGAEPPGPEWVRDVLGIDFMDDVVLVDLSLMQVSDLTPLVGLKNLEKLYLFGTPVSDVTPLAGLKNLKALWLGDTPVSDVTPLAGLKNLQWLDLYGTQVSDVTPLAGLKNLEVLELDSTPVSDVTPLAGLKNLEVLVLDRTQVNEEQVTELQQAIPDCRIRW